MDSDRDKEMLDEADRLMFREWSKLDEPIEIDEDIAATIQRTAKKRKGKMRSDLRRTGKPLTGSIRLALMDAFNHGHGAI